MKNKTQKTHIQTITVEEGKSHYSEEELNIQIQYQEDITFSDQEMSINKELVNKHISGPEEIHAQLIKNMTPKLTNIVTELFDSYINGEDMPKKATMRTAGTINISL